MSQFYVNSAGGGAGSGIQTLTGNSGGAISGDSTSHNVNIIGNGAIEVAGDFATNTLVISGISEAIAWNTVVGTTQTVATDNGYINSNGSLTTYVLPTTSVVGDTFRLAGYSGGGWILTQNANQKIYMGSSTTLTGVGGSLATLNAHDSAEVVCVVANNEWQVVSYIGNIIVT